MHAGPWTTAASLRFYGNGYNDIDRVKIQVDPPTSADVGHHFTIEFWMKAQPGANGSPTCVEGGVNWIYGNIIVDRDVYGSGDYGDFGISLAGGRIAFGVAQGTHAQTICSTSNVADGNWHHIAVTRNATSGLMRIFVDGILERQAVGPTGDVSYRDGRATSYPNSDPYLVLGAEKHDAGPSYPSYNGWLDEFRISTIERYTADFTPPIAPFSPDANTAVLYHFDEAPSGPCTGTVEDASPHNTDGACRFGGNVFQGPVYSPDVPFNTLPFHKASPPDAAVHQPTNMTLSWNPVSGAIAYEYCYTSQPNACSQWHSVGNNTSVALLLAPNYTYYWQVRAVTGSGTFEADNGQWWSFTTQNVPNCAWPPYTPPPVPTFSDVPFSHPFFSWIERLVNSGLTSGYPDGTYRPENPVTRAQMAIFLLKSRHGGSYTPPLVGSSTGFNDVPATHWVAPWVKQLAAEGITSGCGGGNYCPNSPVTRGQMAAFLVRSFIDPYDTSPP